MHEIMKKMYKNRWDKEMPRAESTAANFHLKKKSSWLNILNSHLWELREEEKTKLSAGRWKKTLEDWSRVKQKMKEETVIIK